MPVSKRLYPHEMSGELSLRPKGKPYDPADEDIDLGFLIREEESDEDVQTLDLTGSTGWQSLQIDLQGILPEAELTRVLPSPSQPAEDAALIVSVTCSDTRLRRAVPFAFEDGTWSGTVTIRRDEARGAVRLAPRLVRATDLPGSSQIDLSVATRNGFIIAEGRSLNVRVDPPNRNVEGVLRILWKNFTESEHDWMKQHSGDLLFLDENAAQPTLYLNSHYSQLKAALHSRAKTGPTAAVRHLGNALVAQSAWQQLFTSTAASVDPDADDEDIEDSVSGWRRPVLRAFLQRAFPEVELGEQLKRLRMYRSESQGGVLPAIVSSAAQNAAKTPALIKRASGAVGIVRTVEVEA